MRLKVVNKLICSNLAVFLFFLITLLLPLPASTASFNFETGNKTLGVGQQFKLNVNLNTEGDVINAVGGSLNIPSQLKVNQILAGDSIIAFWVEPPKLTMVNGQSKIIFSGIIPGGLNTPSSPILSAVLQTIAPGAAEVSVTDQQILLNNGMGTPAPITSLPLTLNVVSGAPTTSYQLAGDNIPPEPFLPVVAKDPAIFNGAWFVAWQAVDKLSGISSYSLLESNRFYTDLELQNPTLNWQIVNSPAVLTDQTLNSYIYIKAVDNSGNIRVARLAPKTAYVSYKKYLKWGIIILLVLFIAYEMRKFLCRRKSKVKE